MDKIDGQFCEFHGSINKVKPQKTIIIELSPQEMEIIRRFRLLTSRCEYYVLNTLDCMYDYTMKHPEEPEIKILRH